MTETSNSPMTARVRAFLDRPHRLLIGGEWVDAASGKTFETRDPATGEVLATVAHAEQADIDAAVAAARAAFDEGSWVRMRPNVREDLLWRISNLITERLEDFALLESLDQGKGVGIASAFDVRAAADCFLSLIHI